MAVFEVLSTVAEAAGTVAVEGATEAAKEAVVEAVKKITQEIAKDTLQGVLNEATKYTGVRIDVNTISKAIETAVAEGVAEAAKEVAQEIPKDALQGVLDETTKETGIRIDLNTVSKFPDFFKDMPSSNEKSDKNSDSQTTKDNTNETRNTERNKAETNVSDGKSVFPDFFKDMPLHTSADDINNDTYFAEKDYKHCPVENGEWSGERGNSEWHPDKDYIPGKSNPDGKSMGEILDSHGIDKIVFKNGEPDFSEISEGNIEIEHFTENRTDNFDLADIKMAEQKGCSPEEIRDWRKSNGYTWHECKDMRTMQLVPSEIHNNISHSGGISEIKKGA